MQWVQEELYNDIRPSCMYLLRVPMLMSSNSVHHSMILLYDGSYDARALIGPLCTLPVQIFKGCLPCMCACVQIISKLHIQKLYCDKAIMLVFFRASAFSICINYIQDTSLQATILP